MIIVALIKFTRTRFARESAAEGLGGRDQRPQFPPPQPPPSLFSVPPQKTPCFPLVNSIPGMNSTHSKPA